MLAWCQSIFPLVINNFTIRVSRQQSFGCKERGGGLTKGGGEIGEGEGEGAPFSITPLEHATHKALPACSKGGGGIFANEGILSKNR
jgi:hypothetical protein